MGILFSNLDILKNIFSDLKSVFLVIYIFAVILKWTHYIS